MSRLGRVRAGLGLAAVLAVLGAAFAAGPAAAALKGFDSPSGNIGCVMESRGVRCDIRDHEWQAPPPPKNCELDYGGGVAVDAGGRAAYVCAGDTALNSGPALAYGKSQSFGRYRCTSEEAGMRCVNRRNGHGFLLSRQRVRLF
jgi:hypothetical protein